jgi:hypothetical protein
MGNVTLTFLVAGAEEASAATPIPIQIALPAGMQEA